MLKYILCDIEATGNRDQDKIIQLGLIVFENSIDTQPVYTSNELNSTMAEMMSEAMEIHNITPEMLKDKKCLTCSSLAIKRWNPTRFLFDYAQEKIQAQYQSMNS